MKTKDYYNRVAYQETKFPEQSCVKVHTFVCVWQYFFYDVFVRKIVSTWKDVTFFFPGKWNVLCFCTIFDVLSASIQYICFYIYYGSLYVIKPLGVPISEDHVILFSNIKSDFIVQLLSPQIEIRTVYFVHIVIHVFSIQYTVDQTFKWFTRLSCSQNFIRRFWILSNILSEPHDSIILF